MARFDDAKVGDKVKVPTVFKGTGLITSIRPSNSTLPVEVVWSKYGEMKSMWFTLEGKTHSDSEAPALFYTNDAGELLTERPKRKVKRSWDFVVHGCTWDRDGFPKITLSVESIADLEQFRLTIGKPATLIVEVDE